MRKIGFYIAIVCLMALIITNINFAINGSSGEISLLNLKALASQEGGEVIVYCSGGDNDCFRPSGCQCYTSTFGRCPRCGDSPVYFCGYTGTPADLCGMFELYMLGMPWDHQSGCPYK